VTTIGARNWLAAGEATRHSGGTGGDSLWHGEVGDDYIIGGVFPGLSTVTRGRRT